MGRIFSLLAAAAMLIILISGSGVYWLSSARIAQARQDSALTAANAIALTLSQQLDLLNRTLNKMALDSEVLLAVTRADPVLLATEAARLEKYFPDALKIRLLLPGVSELDEKSTPRMGFADLDMVRETFISDNQLPRIHGYEGADKHLAMTRRIMHNDQAIGVILASLNYDFVNKSLQAAAIKDGTLELKQADLVLGAAGKSVDTGQSESVQTKVAGTDWEIYYHYAAGAGLAEIMLITAAIVAALLLTVIAFVVGYRRLSGLMTQDLNSVLNACKDTLNHKPPGSYPINLSEIGVVIAALMHFKQRPDHSEDSAKYGFIDELSEYDVNENFIEDEFLVDHAEESIDRPEVIELSVDLKKFDEMDAIFRAYDIRGIVGKTLTRERVYDIGRALGTDAKDHGCKTVVMGRDGRISSPQFAEALAEGLVSTGRNVLDIGRVPTPMLYFVAQHTEDRCGAMITGSHNSADYNGLKMVVNGETLAGERIQQIRQCIINQHYAIDEIGRIENNNSYANEYIGTISEDIRIERPMVIVLDCGNGVTGELGPKLLKILGCEVVELFCDVDGSFPNHQPDPSKPENLTELIASVKQYKADLGVALDGDGDRLGVVDSNGKIIWPDKQMMLFAQDILARSPGSEIIFDVKCTGHLANQITKYGGRPVMWKTGQAFMKAKLKETGAALAGEMSGHIFFNDRWIGIDDGLYAAARLIEILSKDTRSSAEVFAQFPDSINTPELKIELEEGEKYIFMESLFAEANFPDGKMTTIDGMRVDFSNGWGLVRVSNTTPSLVICFEADTNKAMLAIQNQFRQLMKKIKPDIVLPF